jgi:hypothetical protein
LPNDQVAPFTQQYGSVSPKAALAITRGAGVEKMFIVWYDTTGQTSVKHRPADAITASPTVIQPGTPKPLAVLADYDTLLIMAHGCADGKMVSSPGATMAALGGMNAVNAAERVRHG